MADATVYFVREDQEPGSAMNEAFEAMCEMMESGCYWIEAHKIRSKFITKDKKIIFIFEQFGSEVFKYLAEIGFKIFGPLCVLTCLKNREVLPRASPHYCFAMTGLTISFTSIPKERRQELHEKVKWMGGEVSADFYDGVTHLVAGEVGSKKYLVASKLQKRIMSPTWIEAVWEASRIQLVNANDPAFLKEHKCPIFQGFVVTASGIDGKERARLRELLEIQGGQYSGEMKKDNCTHLVVNAPQGQKYEFAQKWKIHIVTPQWIFDSIDKGYCLEERMYSVEKDSRSTSDSDSHGRSTSTPTAESKKGRPSILQDVSCISVSTVNETAMTTLGATMFNQSTLSNHNQTMDTTRNNRVRESIANADLLALDKLNLSSYSGSNFLDGCKIFLSGFCAAHMDKLRKIINMGGASRFNVINESVSHVVIGETIDEHIDQINGLTARPHTVTVHWLIDSLKNDNCADEKLYIPPDVTLPADNPTPQRPNTVKRKSSVSAKTLHPEESFHAPKPKVEDKDDKNDDMQDILSQYLPQQTEQPQASTLGESTLLQAAAAAECEGVSLGNSTVVEAPGGAPTNTTLQPQDMETVDPHAHNSDDTTFEEADEGQIFARKSFVIYGFDENQSADLSTFIQSFGGKMAGMVSRAIPDYAVVPIMGYPVERTVKEIVTNAYVQMCSERGAIQPLSANPIYTPLYPKDENAQPLEGVVVSISGFAGTERDALLHVALVLGAICQDYMVRKDNKKKGLKGNTHLIVNAPEGSKFEAARKWNLPAVSKRWLIDCAVKSKRLPEADYDISSDGLENDVTLDEQQLHINTTRNSPKGTPEPEVKLSSGQQMPPPNSTPLRMRKSFETHVPESDTTPKENNSTPKTKNVNVSMPGMDINSPQTPHMDTSLSKHDESSVPARHKSVGDGKGSRDVENEMDTNENVSCNVAESSAKTPDVVRNRNTELDTPAQARKYTPSASNARVKKLIEENRRSSQRVPKTSKTETPTTDDGWETPSKFGVGVVFKPNFDFTAAFEYIDNMETPGRTPGRGKDKRRKESLPLEELFSHHLELAIKNTSKPTGIREQTPVIASPTIVRQDTPKRPLHGVVIAVAKKLTAKQTEYNNIAASLGADYRWSYDSSCTHYLFQGRQNDVNREFREVRQAKKLIVSPHWLLQCQTEERHVDESLYPHTYNPNMALSISGTETPVRARRTTRTRINRTGTENVPPAAGNQNSSDSDTATNARRSSRLTRASRDSALEGTSHSTRSTRASTNDKSATNVASDTSGNTKCDKTQSDDEMAAIVGQVEKEEEKAFQAAYVDDLKSLMAANTRTYAKRRKSTRGTNSSFETSNMADDSSRDSSTSRRPSRPNSRSSTRNDDGEPSNKISRSSRLATHELQTQQVEASQFEVAWDDPVARAQMEKLAGDLAKNSESLSPAHEPVNDPPQHDRSNDDMDSANVQVLRKQKSVDSRDSGPIPTPDPPSFAMLMPQGTSKLPSPQPVEPMPEEENPKTTPNMPRKFILSGIAREERDDYGALVEQLGGELLDSANYDSRATHLIVEKPTRNEKFLGSIAAGKWVMHKSYFEACRNAGRFEKEDVYEWGSDETIKTLTNPSHAKWARAAKRWRQKFAESNQRVFDGWQVVLLTKKVDSFIRLLQAGGADIIASKPPFSEDQLSSCTHAFFEPKLVDEHVTQQDLVTLVHSDAVCVKPEFVAEALLEERPSVDNHIIPHINALLGGERKRKTNSDLPSTPSGKRQRKE